MDEPIGIEHIPEIDQEVGMEPLGEIIEIWRYPVSSLGGERLTSAVLGSDGIAFDRAWCICDAETGAPAAPEKELRWRPALFLSARLGEDNRPEIGFPDGGWTGVDDAGLAERLAAHFGPALVEMALIDAVCRAHDLNFPQAARADLFGVSALAAPDISPAAITGALAGITPLPAIAPRQTVGFDAPVFESEADPGRVDDGLPVSLEAIIRATGIRA
ncbi:MAG: MOSC N-terminal beta barrel domain-containing protein, partial [Martelella sp.]